MADGSRPIGDFISNDGEDFSAESGFTLHCPDGFSNASRRRGSDESVNKYVSYGASPRAAIAIAEAARAHALVAGRPSVGFEDVKVVAQPVLNHRLILNYQARFDRMTPSKLVTELFNQLDETGLNLPKDVELASARYKIPKGLETSKNKSRALDTRPIDIDFIICRFFFS